ncbi:hypothetical protein [Nocardioides sp. LHG3406-4]|uniref:hypothetical protein n=1 Tax=Nocardioides sp. LHG3406-4 TaxID=2804575 RepID=UPI003CFA796B
MTVTGLRTDGGPGQEELVIEFSLPDTPPGVCRQPYNDAYRARPRRPDSEAYATELGREIQGWATEHLRRYHPPEPIDREQVRHELPTGDGLWRMLIDHFDETTPVPQGFRGTAYGSTITVVLTPEEWQEHVISCEIGCRMDYGVDADREGSGPYVAFDALDEIIGTLDPEELYVVFDGREFRGSTRAELPAVPGTAGEREHAQSMRRLAEARAANPDVEFGWFAYRPDGSQTRLGDD